MKHHRSTKTIFSPDGRHQGTLLFSPRGWQVHDASGKRLSDGPRVERLAVLGQDLEAVAGKGEPMSDYIIGCFAVAFRFCCSPGPLQFLLGIVGRLREGEN